MNQNDKRKTAPSEESVPAYGGYSTRHDYERLQKPKKSRTFAIGVAGAAILCLIVLAALGIFALVSGKLLPKSENEGEGAGSIRVPTQSELLVNYRTPTECLEYVSPSLVTFEVVGADDMSHFGSGFIISVDGYAVCSTSLLPANGVTKRIAAHFSGGFTSEVRYVGKNDKCGVALLQVSTEMDYTPVTAGNFDFVKRGETLLVAASVYAKAFYGTAVEGMVASVGQTLQASGNENETILVPVAFLDVPPNASLHGAPVLNESGLVVGFCTDTVKSQFGSMTAVIPINAVYTVINDILANA